MKYFDYNIYNERIEDIFSEGFESSKITIIATINPHSFIVAENDKTFKSALKNTNILLADGIGIKLVNLFRFKSIKVYNGPYLHDFIIKNYRNYPLRMFYMGSSNSVLNKIVERHQLENPLWDVAVYSPPYSECFSSVDNELILKHINNFKPNILFVGLTAPKQEKWVELNKHRINANYVISIGAVFDFFSGEKKFAPLLFRKLYLIWFFRLLIDFKHVWKRTFISLPKFLIYNIRFVFKIKSS